MIENFNKSSAMRFYNSVIKIALTILMVAGTGCLKRSVGDLLPELMILDGVANGNFSVGGRITGLVGSNFVLSNRHGGGVQRLSISPTSTLYRFPSVLRSFDSFNVTVDSYPTLPTQLCTVENAGGRILGDSVTNIDIACVDAYLVTGNVAGLLGTGLKLANKGGDLLSLSTGMTTFQFFKPVAMTATCPPVDEYNVTVHSNPSVPYQTCTFGGATTNGCAVADVTLPLLTCTTNQYHVFVAFDPAHPLTYDGLQLAMNGGATVTIPKNSVSFDMGLLNSGLHASVTIPTQPLGQSCTIVGGERDITNADVTATIGCTTYGYLVGGNLANLDGNGLTLELRNGSGVLVATAAPANGASTYLFGTALPYGSNYQINIANSAPTSNWQDCAFDAGGTIYNGVNITGNINNLNVTCITRSFSVGGTISGLNAAGLQLELRDTTAGSVVSTMGISSGATTFNSGINTIPSGHSFAVSVVQSPATQLCTINTGTEVGIVAGGIVNSVAISCVDLRIGGQITGLSGATGSLALRLAETLNPANFISQMISLSATSYTYGLALPVSAGTQYSLSVDTQPTGKSCSMVRSQFTMPASSVTNADLYCTVNPPPASVTDSWLYNVSTVQMVIGGVTYGNTATVNAAVAGGLPVSVNFNYTLSNGGCPGCIIAFLVGIVGNPSPSKACSYPTLTATPTPISFTLTVPTVPGTYVINSWSSQDYCSTPGLPSYFTSQGGSIAILTVQ